jgi:hypothetical protein
MMPYELWNVFKFRVRPSELSSLNQISQTFVPDVHEPSERLRHWNNLEEMWLSFPFNNICLDAFIPQFFVEERRHLMYRILYSRSDVRQRQQLVTRMQTRRV